MWFSMHDTLIALNDNTTVILDIEDFQIILNMKIPMGMHISAYIIMKNIYICVFISLLYL